MHQKLRFFFWFYLLVGLGIWGSIPFVLFNNVIIRIILCFHICSKWGGYIALWYLNQLCELKSQIKDEDTDFKDL